MVPQVPPEWACQNPVQALIQDEDKWLIGPMRKSIQDFCIQLSPGYCKSCIVGDGFSL
jgi:hypothetical protein